MSPKHAVLPVVDLHALVAAIAAEIVEHLDARAVSQGHGYYTAKHNPLGERAFLDAARAGRFPSYRPGKIVLARCADVDAYIQSRPNKLRLRRRQATTSANDLAALTAAGLRPAR